MDNSHDTTAICVDIGTVQRFLEAVWQTAQQSGWPVNAYLVSPQLFGSDVVSNWYTTRAILKDCKSKHWLDVTTGGEIHGVSESAKALIGVSARQTTGV